MFVTLKLLSRWITLKYLSIEKYVNKLDHKCRNIIIAFKTSQELASLAHLSPVSLTYPYLISHRQSSPDHQSSKLEALQFLFKSSRIIFLFFFFLSQGKRLDKLQLLLQYSKQMMSAEIFYLISVQL